MDTSTSAARQFWTGMLTAGGFTAIPRWCGRPAPGVADHEAPIPAEVATALRRLTDELVVPVSSVLLAAHAVVLAALSGESDVTTGYVPTAGGRPLPCHLTTVSPTWRGVVADAHRTGALLHAYGDHPVDDLRRDLRLTGPSFETVLDATGGDLGLDDAVVLAVGLLRQGAALRLRLRYRTDVLDAEAAARFAGYLVTALGLTVTDPDAEHRRQTLLSPEELRFQLAGLDGPRRVLPDRRVHELFEERVRIHPDAVAAVHRDRHCTYRELNTRANRLARTLLAHGLRREDVIGVVMERDLDWMATVLAIWKAGGAYLPLEPHFPAARIATALSRAGCGLVVTEPGSAATLDQALESLPGVQRLDVATIGADACGDDLGIAVDADQLAYVLFTSGSTGEPKGAMCEHAGMLNHLYAKLGDLAVAEGEVIPQTGPQCFDISVWQLVGALVVGGRTLIVDQDVLLDVERFVDTLVAERAAVLQVVPSYLDVVLSYLERNPRQLPDLHTVCPTGDFLKKELVQRWFAAQPGIPMVNTYGLTETSDDAVHEIMDRVPGEERVPLGRPIINTTVYVADEHLTPVPLGAPGLIVFAGVCVGRGYVNDPERTARMFEADPHRPGRRLCRTGDYGRWRPDGKLDFLGRRDNQVKIRGFRIEIGEVENALLRVPGVRDGAAVVAEGADRSPRLVAFYSSDRPVAVEDLRGRLAEVLPDYMVPAAFHWRAGLPLTPNGKIDRTTLTAVAGALDTVDADAPRTPTEQRLAAAWAAVLGVPLDRIGRRDDFFALGGTSLSSVKLAIALDRAVSPKDLVRSPVLADLADLLDAERPAALATP
jgi:amino acid adenylation domain-containing protein